MGFGIEETLATNSRKRTMQNVYCCIFCNRLNAQLTSGFTHSEK